MSKNALRTIEIFKAGKHTSVEGQEITFSEADLAAAASAYDPAVHEAPLVVGHPKLDGPAYGWVQKVTTPRKGTLEAAVDQVDASFAELVNAGRFKKISASFYLPDAANNPVPGVYYLRHVGVLGATPPAIKGLKPASFGEDKDGVATIEFAETARFGEWDQKTIARIFGNMRDFFIEKFGLEAADRVVPSYEIDYLQDNATREGMKDNGQLRSSFAEPHTNTTKETDVKTQEQIAAEAAKLKEREDAIAAREASFAEREKKERRAANGAFIDGLIKDGKFPSAHKDAMLSFMERLDVSEVVSFGEGDKAPKATELDQLKAFLNAYPPSVQFGEIAGSDKTVTSDAPQPNEKTIADEITAHIKKKADEGISVSYAEAAAAVGAKYVKA